MSYTFTVCLTHDVDRVYKTYQYFTHDLRELAFRRLRTAFDGSRPYWQFEHVMELEDRYSVRSTFFFLQESLRPRWYSPRSWILAFGRYRFSDPAITRIVRKLDAGGWEVALHGSYLSYRSGELLSREKEELERVLGRSVMGIRQHYLNLDVPQTWRLQRSAGFHYDASFGKRRAIGFRDGRTSAFVDQHSGIIVIPLAIMDGYLFREAEGDSRRAWALARDVVDEAETCSGTLVLLWHPHLFYDDEFRGYGRMYEELIQYCIDRGARFKTCREISDEVREGARTGSSS